MQSRSILALCAVVGLCGMAQAGLIVWLDGKDPLGTGTPPVDNTVIGTWYDKSGLGNNLSAVGTGPTYHSTVSGLNRPALTFNSNRVAVPDNVTVTVGTVLTVMDWTGAATFPSWNTAVGAKLYSPVNEAFYLLQGRPGETNLDTQYALAGANWINGAPNNSFSPMGTFKVAAHTVTSPLALHLQVGCDRAQADRFWYGDIADVLAYNNTLSADQVAGVSYWMAQKWGIAGVTATQAQIDAGTALLPAGYAGQDIPEPATMALLGLAVTGLGGYIRRRRAA